MDRGRRLKRLEDGLDPLALVLRWLDEAHTFGTIGDYVLWLIDQPDGAHPIERLPREIADATYEAMRRQPSDVIERKMRRAKRDTVFLFDLVVRLNREAMDLIRIEELRRVALVFRMRELDFRAALAARGEEAARQAEADTLEHHHRTWQDIVGAMVDRLGSAHAARETLEQRYLAGHAALFPDVADAWQGLLRHTTFLAGLASGTGRSAKSPSVDPEDVRRLVRRSRYEAHTAMGEDRKAEAMARAIVSDRLAPPALEGDGA